MNQAIVPWDQPPSEHLSPNAITTIELAALGMPQDQFYSSPKGGQEMDDSSKPVIKWKRHRRKRRTKRRSFRKKANLAKRARRAKQGKRVNIGNYTIFKNARKRGS